MHRVRYAMAEPNQQEKLSGTVEVDETYVGGKPRFRGKNKVGRGTKKTPVLSLIERQGNVRAHVIPNVTGKTLRNAICLAHEFENQGYRIVSGGTDNHLVLIDLRSKGLIGVLAETTLESVGIIVNRNIIPGDPERPDVTSGIRIGSPAITSRGMRETEVRQIVAMMDTAMLNRENPQILKQVTKAVQDLCKKFPVN